MVRLAAVASALALALVGVRQDRSAAAVRADALAQRLRSPSGDVPHTARAVCEALDQAGPPGLSVAFGLLDGAAPHARAGAAAYLGLRRSHRAVPHLIRLLRDPDPTVRRAAASALGAIGDPQALPFLRRTMASDRLDVAEAALRAARHIQAGLEPQADG